MSNEFSEKPYVEPVSLPERINRTTARMGDDGTYYVTQTPKKVGGHAGLRQDMTPKEIEISEQQYQRILEMDTKKLAKEIVTLPIYPNLKNNEQNRIFKVIKNWYMKNIL